MRQVFVACWALIVLASISVMGLDVQTDTISLTSRDSNDPGTPSLEVNRDMLVAVRSDDMSLRNDLSRRLVAKLRQNPLVERASHGPDAPSDAFMAWIWENRFLIAPPAPDAFETEQMIAQLEASKATFSSVEGMGVGDQLLLDPTGSYARVLLKLNRAEAAMSLSSGVWQAKNGQAAIIHVTLADHQFDAKGSQNFVTSIRSFVENEGAVALLVGAQIIAAETTIDNTRASAFATLLATGLLIAWLIWSLRSLAVIAVFVPLAVGLATAVCIVQALYGFVHVTALGFGGALLGLALDYPIHVMGQSGTARHRAFRLIFLGASTTCISFLAMLGSNILALEQIGVFVATGLIAAAIVTIAMPVPNIRKIHVISLDHFVWHLPFKPWVESTLVVAGFAFAFSLNTTAALTLFAPPAHVKADIDEMGQLVDLPSGRFAILVRGQSLDELLNNEKALASVLEQAISDGQLIGYKMLHQMMSPHKSDLPPPAVFHEAATGALSGANMNVSFASRQVDAYEQALKAAPIRYDDLLKFPETQRLALRLKETDQGWQETVQLYLPKGVARPNFTVLSRDAELVDLLAPIRHTLRTVQSQMIRWLVVGLGIGTILLALGLRSWPVAWQILRTNCAAVAVTACILILIFGGLSIFHIVAMALVVGIGVDYSIFLRNASDDPDERSAGRSVALCALSTFLAFIVLCFSNVLILNQIGLTVIIGLSVMLALTLANNEECLKS